jgi:hypothetical protein
MMDDIEFRQKILDILDLAKENNKLLRSLRRAQRWAMFMRLVYWVLIIGITLGAYYYIQPYFDQIIGTYSNFQDIGVNFPSREDIDSLINKR